MTRLLPLPERDWIAPASKRVPGIAAIALARGLNRIPRRPARERDPSVLVVAFGNLGDQLRFLNVATRIVEPPALRYVANAESAAAFALYGIRPEIAFARHGVDALPSAAMGLFLPPRRHATGLVPLPLMTQSIAVAYARARAERVETASTGEYPAYARDATLRICDVTSWRSFFEDYFAATAIARHGFDDRPALLARAARAPDRTREVGLHVGSSDARRAMPVDVASRVVDAIADLGFVPYLLGVAAESEHLRAIARGSRRGAALVVGRPLVEVATRIGASAAFVCVDSSMMSLADALLVPMVPIYATTDAGAGPFYAPSAPVRVARASAPGVVALMGRSRVADDPDWRGVERRIAANLRGLAPIARS